MKKYTCILLFLTALALSVTEASAQRNRDGGASEVGRIIQGFTGQNRGSRDTTRNSNGLNSRQRNRQDSGIQGLIENRIRNEIGSAVGIPNRTNRGLRSNQRFNNRRASGRNSLSNGRYRNNSLANTIMNQFPQASRILAPRNVPQRGGFYSRNGDHYYYPRPVYPSGVQQASGTIADGTVISPPADMPEPVPVEFGGYAYVGELSRVLPQVINDLCLDMHYNYRNSADFSDVYRDAYAMLQNATRLSAAHSDDDRDKVKELAKTVDRLQHRVEEQTRGWTRQETRQVGELGIVTKLSITGDVVHHLLHDIGVTEDEHSENNRAVEDRRSELRGTSFADPKQVNGQDFIIGLQTSVRGLRASLDFSNS